MSTRHGNGRASQRVQTPPSLMRTSEVMISLRAPVSREKIARWVEEQVDRLRGEARATGVRLGRLTVASPPQRGDWLVEVDVRDQNVRLEDNMALASVLTDMELLGLRPQLLVTSTGEGAPQFLIRTRRLGMCRRGGEARSSWSGASTGSRGGALDK